MLQSMESKERREEHLLEGDKCTRTGKPVGLNECCFFNCSVSYTREMMWKHS